MRVPFNPRKSERGQAFLELAVSLMFLLILFTVLVDLGWAFYEMIAMRDAAQEAAAYGSMCPPNITNDVNAVTKIKTRLKETAGSPLNLDKIVVDPSNPTNDTIVVKVINPSNPAETNPAPVKGNSVYVEFSYTHKIIVPLVSTFIGTTEYPLKVNVSDTILRNENTGCQ